MSVSPIVLFVYNRPDHTRRTVESLASNHGASESDLYIFSDAPKNDSAAANVAAVRNFIKGIKGFRSVNVAERETNLGLSRSIISGVTEIIDKCGKAIVLEDDLMTSPYFLKFMNEALDKFENIERVIQISGYMFPAELSVSSDITLLPFTSSWGWATWKRAWDDFERNGRKLLDEINGRNLRLKFDINGAMGYSKMLENQIKGLNDSWAVRFYASAFLAGKLTLFPARSLVKNIGNDNSGVHCKASDNFSGRISQNPVKLDEIDVAENKVSLDEIERFLKSVKPGAVIKIFDFLKYLINKAIGKQRSHDD